MATLCFEIWLNAQESVLGLSEADLTRQGYRIITAKWGPHKGQRIYWHPTTKDIVPVDAPTPPVVARPTYEPPVADRPLGSSRDDARDFIINFGKKYKGRSYKEANTGYLIWMVNTVGERYVDKDTREEIEEYIKTRSDYDRELQYWLSRGNQLRPESLLKGPPATIATPISAPQQATLRKSAGDRPTPEQVKIPGHQMTEFNKAIEEKFHSTDAQGRPQSIMIDALAGTGKTTMLKHLASFMKPGEKWLYLVFNKKNQVESEKAFPEIVKKNEKGEDEVIAEVDVMTTHSFLGKVLKKAGKNVGGGTRLPPQDAKWQKIYRVADKLIPLNWPESKNNYYSRKKGEMVSPFHWKAKNRVTKIASLAKAFAIDPRSGANLSNQLLKIISKYNMDMDISTERTEQDKDYTPDILEKTTELLKVTLPQQLPKHLGQELANYRDQDDTLWYAAINANEIDWNLGYDVVLMDEVQDFNMAQLVMAKKLKETGARVIGVGDKNQSMYLFRGADEEAFDKLKGIISGGSSMSLPINFRSGENIINWVKDNTHVKDLQHAPHMAGKGAVHQDVNYDEFMGNIQDEYRTNGRNFDEQTAIISRRNAPLAEAALKFLKNNVDFQIIGKDLSKELIDHIKRVTYSKPERHDIENFADTLGGYFMNLQDKWANKIAKKDELKEIEETTDTLASVLRFLEDNGWREDDDSRPMTNAKDFVKFIERKLGGLDPDNHKDAKKLKAKDPNSYVTLTTAHKAKGLEFDRVFLMNPGDYDPRGKKIRTPSAAQQERNAWYVAATRAKNNLHIHEQK